MKVAIKGNRGRSPVAHFPTGIYLLISAVLRTVGTGRGKTITVKICWRVISCHCYEAMVALKIYQLMPEGECSG